jgi:hypothetical protein
MAEIMPPALLPTARWHDGTTLKRRHVMMFVEPSSRRDSLSRE